MQKLSGGNQEERMHIDDDAQENRKIYTMKIHFYCKKEEFEVLKLKEKINEDLAFFSSIPELAVEEGDVILSFKGT